MEDLQRLVGLCGRNGEHHANAHVEGVEHVVLGDAAHLLHQVEQRRGADILLLDAGAAALLQAAGDVLIEAAAGDVILALPSTGVHSNGFSLVRKIFDIDNDPDVLHTTPAELGGKTLGDALLAPTKIYVKPVLKVLEEVDVKGISHITGGGFYENIPRSLKKGCCARINKVDVRTPALFQLMQKTGNISEHDMFNTFNMGVGMVLTVPAEQADKALDILHANGEPEAYRLGVIAEGEGVELC